MPVRIAVVPRWLAALLRGDLTGPFLVLTGGFVIVTWAVPALAFGQNPPGPGEPVPVPDGPAAGFVPLYVAALGLVVPLVGYLINYFGPQTSEQVKGLVHAVLSAGVGVLYQAVTPGDLGLNDQTLLACLVSMGAALAGHIGYKVGGINRMLGAGQNRNGEPETELRLVGRA